MRPSLSLFSPLPPSLPPLKCIECLGSTWSSTNERSLRPNSALWLADKTASQEMDAAWSMACRCQPPPANSAHRLAPFCCPFFDNRLFNRRDYVGSGSLHRNAGQKTKICHQFLLYILTKSVKVKYGKLIWWNWVYRVLSVKLENLFHYLFVTLLLFLLFLPFLPFLLFSLHFLPPFCRFFAISSNYCQFFATFLSSFCNIVQFLW